MSEPLPVEAAEQARGERGSGTAESKSRRRIVWRRDTVPAASPLAPRAGKKSGEYGGRQTRRLSSITHGRETSCDHNLHVVSYLAKVGV